MERVVLNALAQGCAKGADSFQSLQRWDPVAFLQRGRVSGDLAGVELDLLRVFLRLDLDEAAFERVLHGFGQIVQRANLFSIDRLYAEIREIFVTDRSIGWQHLTQHHDLAMTLREKLRLVTVEINEFLRAFALKVTA